MASFKNIDKSDFIPSTREDNFTFELVIHLFQRPQTRCHLTILLGLKGNNR